MIEEMKEKPTFCASWTIEVLDHSYSNSSPFDDSDSAASDSNVDARLTLHKSFLFRHVTKLRYHGTEPMDEIIILSSQPFPPTPLNFCYRL